MKKLFLLIPAFLLSLAVSASTDFAAPGYYCAADAANLSGSAPSEKFFLNSETDPHSIVWYDVAFDAAVATWNITATRSCYISVTLDLGSYDNNKHIFEVKILQGSTEIGTVAEGAADPEGDTYGYNNDYDKVKPLEGSIFIPEAGEYTVKLRNIRGFGKGAVKNVILTYAGGAQINIPAVSIPFGDAIFSTHAWLDKTGTSDSIRFARADHEGEAADVSYTVAGSEYVKWNVRVANDGYYKFTANTYCKQGHNYRIMLLSADESSTIHTWQEAEGNGHDHHNEKANWEISTDVWNIPAGNYVLKVQARAYGRLLSLAGTYVGGAVQTLPTTTDNSEAWFSPKGTRADGMITFPTYADQWVKWNIATANTKSYDVTLNINNPTAYGHWFSVAIYENGNEVPVASFTESSWNQTYGTPLAIPMGSTMLQSGKNYVVKVTNAENGAQPKIISVTFASAGGGLIDLPGDIDFDEAIYSQYAWLDNSGTADSIRFARASNEGEAADENYTVAGSQYVKWRINVENGGYYKFTANTYCKQGHNYRIMLLSADESATIHTWQEAEGNGHAWGSQGSNLEISTPVWNIPAGEYVLKVQARAYGRLLSLTSSYEGGAVVNLPNADIPFNEAILHGATRDGDGIHFGATDRYAEWNVTAEAGVYSFTFQVVGTNYGKYQLTIKDGETTIYDEFKGLDGNGSVTHSSIYLNGNYTLKVANTNSGANGYITSIAATAASDIFVLDENTTEDGSVAAKDEAHWRLMLRRTFTAGKYYSICIPIDSYDDELTSVFGTGYELWKMESATQNGEEVSLNFTQITNGAFSAGTPYLIKPAQDVANPTFSSHTIHNSTDNNVKSFAAADFVGSFYKTEIPAGENNLYLQNNNLYYSETNDTPIKGTRAWIRLKPQGPNYVKARIVLGPKVVTSINLVNGELLDGTVKTIENGQLVIIRDGVKYNAMGIKFQ